MLQPLDGSKLKIIRAEQHLKLLRVKCGRHLKRYTKTVIASDGDTKSVTHSAHLTVDVPPQFSLFVGDCVTNSRAALDYIMWELASKYFIPTVDIANHDDRRITAFPIFTDRADTAYTDRLKRFTNRQVPAPVIDIIKSVQPYNAGYEPLAVLQTLVNTDKHRMPLMTIPGYQGAMILDTWLLKDLINKQAKSTGGTFDINVGTFTISAGNNTSSVTFTKADMDVYLQPEIFITWQDAAMPREPVDRTLENIVKCVADIIPRFEPFF